MGRRKKLPRVLDEGEQEALLERFDRRWWTPDRDRTACLVMLDGGLRVSEVCALELDHVDLAKRKLTVREGKGDADRVVPLTPRLADALGRWLERRAEEVEDCRFVFPSRRGNRLHPNQLRRSLSRAADRAELKEAEKVTPHTLRHTAAVDLLRHTGRLEIVQNFLGHADISTTRVYARLVNGEVQEAVSTFRGGEAEEEEESLADVLADLDAETATAC